MGKQSLKNTNQSKSVTGSILAIVGYVVGIIALIGSYALGRYLGLGYFIILLILGLPIYLGNLYAKWYLKRKSPNVKWVEVLAWLNIILWVIPPLGLFAGSATLKFNSKNSNSRKKYYVLSITALVLSLLNAALGIYLGMMPGGF